jgi:hypothetical protein
LRGGAISVHSIHLFPIHYTDSETAKKPTECPAGFACTHRKGDWD